MLEEKFTSELMVFTMKSLKLHKVKACQYFSPISLVWIKKASFLISKGKYKYLNEHLFTRKSFCHIIFIENNI